MPKVIVKNIGPVDNLEIDLPVDGAIKVLEGRCGTGKSRVLDAINTLVSGKGSLTLTRGKATAEVSAFGATVRYARKLSRSGELVATSLEGKFSIKDLVDPGLSTEDLNDNTRIKALLQLTSSESALSDISLFYPAIGGKEEFQKHVVLEDIKGTDLVTIASSVKRAFEKAARVAGDEYKKLSTQALTARSSAGEVNVFQEDDELVLAQEQEEAIRAEAKIKQQFESFEQLKRSKAIAMGSLVAAKEQYQGPDVETAREEVINLGESVKQAEETLRRAKDDYDQAKAALKSAEDRFSSASLHAKLIDDIQKILDAPLEEVTEDQVYDAADRVTSAREASNAGTLARKAKADLARAAELEIKANIALDQETGLRQAAAATDNVLSEAVGKLGCPLKVSGGRLVTLTDVGEELFSDLSRGEKYALVIDIAINAVGRGGIIVLEQEAWEGLEPQIKSMLAEKVENTGVWIITAQVNGDDEISVEDFDGFLQ